jgi:L-asparaginase II
VHFGAVAVATPEGTLVASQGDPRAATYLRSAAKPFQALPLLLAGGEERYALSAADLALICASHSGTPEHTRKAESLLSRGGFTVADLLCGAHAPFDPESARRLLEEGSPPTALHNNCSGKHAGMLLACQLLGFPPQGYVAEDHPLQRLNHGHVATFCRIAPEAIGIGVDGCSVPAYHIPLAAAARGYAALAHPEAAALPADVAAAAGRIVAAMTAEPGMVAGPARFTTRLMQVTGGRVLGKEGAEGFYGLAVRGPVALGIAVKIADGGERARDSVVLDVLRRMGSLSGSELAALAEAYYAPEIRNWRGLRVGRIEPQVDLTDLDETAAEPD